MESEEAIPVPPRILARIYLGDVLRYTLEQGSDARTVLLRDALQPDDICELDRRILEALAQTFLHLSHPEGTIPTYSSGLRR